MVYLGSLLALLAHSFFRLDEFSGQIVYEWGLSAYVELLTQRANLDIILRTVLMAAAVTVASAVIAFPIAYMAARYRRPARSRRCSISASCCRSGRAISCASMPGS